MRDDWYVRVGNNIQGPFTASQLKAAAAKGSLSQISLVRAGRNGKWIAAAKIAGLFGGSQAASQKPTLPQPPSQLQPAKRRPSYALPLVVVGACLGGLVLVVGAGLIAFELGRRQTVVQAEPPRVDTNPRPQPEPPAPRTPAPQRIPPPPVNQRPPSGPRSPVPPTPPDPSPRVTKKDPAPSPPSSPKPSLTKPPAPPIAKAQKIAKASPKPLSSAGPKKPATNADFRELEKATSGLPSAKEVLAYFDDFASNHTMTALQSDKFKEDRAVWESRANQDLMRLGKKWVSQADLAQARDEANSLISQAYEMAKILNMDEACKALEKASRIDPDSIAAEFTLGLFNSIMPPKMRHPQKAVQHFQEVLRRVPGYLPALNNLALAEMRSRKYPEALRYLRKAAERSPRCQEVTQNLGRLASEMRLGRIHANKKLQGEVTRVYSHVVTDKRGSAAKLHLGWLYLPFVPPKDERDGLASIRPSAGGAKIWDYAQGTGFVVEPHYLLTCRHVVDDPTLGAADRVEVIDPLDSSHQHRLPATLVAMCPDDDLALLQCDQLSTPPLSLASTVPQRGAEILVIGFPGGSAFGFGLKTTRGIVTAVPGAVARMPGPRWFDFSHDLWYDAATSHGASGAAVFEKHGNVVAVHAAGVQPGNDPSNAKYAGGVPSVNAVSFIRQSLPSYNPNTRAGAALEWTDVDAKSSPSIALLVVGYRQIPIAVGGADQKQGGDCFDDRVCTACNGTGQMVCPNCNGSGSVGVDHTQVTVTQTPFGPQRNVDPLIVYRPCPRCGATGHLHCAHCANGIDPGLR